MISLRFAAALISLSAFLISAGCGAQSDMTLAFSSNLQGYLLECG